MAPFRLLCIICRWIPLLFLALPLVTCVYLYERSVQAYIKLTRAVHGKFDHSIPSHLQEMGDASHYSMRKQSRRLRARRYEGIDIQPQDTSSSLMHIVCTEYTTFQRALRDLDDSGIRHAQYYSSVQQDLGCAMAALSTEQRNRLEHTEFSHIEYILIIPLGNIRKLDSSLLFGISWLQHSADPTKEALTAWISREHPIISYLNGSTQAELSPRRLQVSIGYRSSWADHHVDTSRGYVKDTEVTQQAAVARWFDKEYMDAPNHISSFSDVTVRNRQQRTWHRAKRSSEQHSRNFVDAWAKLASRTPTENFVNNFDQWVVNSFGNNGSASVDGEYCNYHQFGVEHYANRINLKMTSAQLGEDHDHYLYPSAKNAFCLMHLVRAISSDVAVTSITLSPPIRLLNHNARLITQSGRSFTEPWSAVDLDGNGQIVGVSDTGIDENSCFFIDKVYGKSIKSSIDNPKIDHHNRKIVEYITYSGNDNDIRSGHGSHVCGSIAGFCEIDDQDHSVQENVRKYHGIAPQAKLAFFDIMGDDDSGDLYIPYFFQDLFEPAYFAGARLHSNSWGGGYSYDSFCLDVDEFSYTHPDFLAFFAAGNDGFQGAYTILSPAMAKNVVAVAGSDNQQSNIGTIAGFSAEGPTFDGRIKPDITVPGQSITSANSHGSHVTHETCDTTPKAGTSMATPIAAGNGALIKQYFKDKKFWASVCSTMKPYSDLQNIESNFVNFESLCASEGIDLSGAMLKALILQAGTPMQTGRSVAAVPPDNRQGYGLINLSDLLIMPSASLAIPSTTLFIDETSLSSYMERIYTITIVDDRDPLKATLSWFDPPNLEFAAKILLHDIDLTLTDPNGVIYFGNYKTSSNLDNIAYRDEMNNNEQIYVEIAARGEWTLKVQSKLLTQTERQKYALVVKSNGHVDSITEADLIPSFFSHCGTQSTSHEAMLYTHISLFDLVGVDGWKAGNHFNVVKVADGVHGGHQDVSIISGSLGSGLEYDFTSVCLSPGSYYIELVMDASGADDGIQLEIAQCEGLFIGPLATKQYFHITSEDVTYNEVPVKTFPMGSCKLAHGTIPSASSSFSSSSPSSMMINVTLFEGGGVGWSGAYYSIHSYGTFSQLVGGCSGTRFGCCADGVTSRTNVDGTNCDDDNYGSSGLFAGSLEWGYLKHAQISVDALEMDISGGSSAPYIRVAEQEDTVISTNGNLCFLTMLSTPVTQQPELQPMMAFDDAVNVRADGRAEECPYNLNLDTPIVLICPDFYNNSVDFTFYENTYISTSNFGQSKTSWTIMNRVFDSSVKIGRCTIDKRYVVLEEQDSDLFLYLALLAMLSIVILVFTLKTFFFNTANDENSSEAPNGSMPLPSRDPSSISVSVGLDDGGSPKPISPRSMAMNPMHHDSLTIAAAANAMAADTAGRKNSGQNRGGGGGIFKSNNSRGYEMVGMKSPSDHRLDVSEHNPTNDLEATNIGEDEDDDELEIKFSDVFLSEEDRFNSDGDVADSNSRITNNRITEQDLEVAEAKAKSTGTPNLRI